MNIHKNPLKWILNTQLILCKYDSDQWELDIMKPPHQLRITNPVRVLAGNLDPSTLILIAPPCGNFHPMHWVCFGWVWVWWGEKDGEDDGNKEAKFVSSIPPNYNWGLLHKARTKHNETSLQLWITNPVRTHVGDLDPSKLILIALPCGNFHPMNWVCFGWVWVWWGKKDGEDAGKKEAKSVSSIPPNFILYAAMSP